MKILQQNNENLETVLKEHVLTSMEDSQIKAVEEILCYTFSDKSLLEEAMTHRTFNFALKPSELHGRLEYIGDSLLNRIVDFEIFHSHPKSNSGDLTRLRSVNTDKEKLGRVAVAHGLHHYIRHKCPQIDIRTQEFIRDMKYYPVHSNGLLDPPKALSDVVESLLGAIYVDTNYSYDTAEKIFKRLLQPFVTIETLGMQTMSELNEIYQSLGRTVELNDKWAQTQTIEILLDRKVISSATYSHRKDVCRNRAAQVAINRIKELIRIKELEPISKANGYHNFRISNFFFFF